MAHLPTNLHLARACYLGADAALAAGASLLPTDDEAARTLAGDITWATAPDLTGTGVDDPTAQHLAWEILGPDTLAQLGATDAARAAEALADAWQAGRDLLWPSALLATALRVVGDSPATLALEARADAAAARLREAGR
jgi:hypothetical protein